MHVSLDFDRENFYAYIVMSLLVAQVDPAPFVDSINELQQDVCVNSSEQIDGSDLNVPTCSSKIAFWCMYLMNVRQYTLQIVAFCCLTALNLRHFID